MGFIRSLKADRIARAVGNLLRTNLLPHSTDSGRVGVNPISHFRGIQQLEKPHIRCERSAAWNHAPIEKRGQGKSSVEAQIVSPSCLEVFTIRRCEINRLRSTGGNQLHTELQPTRIGVGLFSLRWSNSATSSPQPRPQFSNRNRQYYRGDRKFRKPRRLFPSGEPSRHSFSLPRQNFEAPNQYK